MNTPTIDNLTVICPISFRRGESGKKRLAAGPAEPPPLVIPRVAKLMALALRLDRFVTDGTVESSADLARLGGVSYTRVTQILNLLHLAPDIQEELLLLDGSGAAGVNETNLRPVVAEIDWGEQRRLWAKMKERLAGAGFEV